MIVTATALPRVMKCDGPVALAGFVPASEPGLSDDIIQGNAAHRLLQLCLKREISSCLDMVGQQVNGNFITTIEMASHVQTHVDTILSRGGQNYPEETTDWNIPDASGNRITGRADNISVVGNVVYVDEFKYGWRIVDVFENWTMISHAIGFCVANGLLPDQIVFTVHQPRPNHLDGKTRTWSLSPDEVQKRQNEIRERFGNIRDTLTTGPHCYKCPVHAACSSSRLAALTAIEVSKQAMPENLTPEAIDCELLLVQEAEKVISNRKKALEAEAKAMLKSGKPIKNFGLEPSFGNRKWFDFVNAEAVKAMTGVDISKPSLITPTQAITKGIPENVVHGLSEVPSTGFKIVRIDLDKKAKEMFK